VVEAVVAAIIRNITPYGVDESTSARITCAVGIGETANVARAGLISCGGLMTTPSIGCGCAVPVSVKLKPPAMRKPGIEP
jgi:hypothetical protein